MRPLWEKTLTWGVADHLRGAGVSESDAYSTAALIVRDLDRRYGLGTELSRYVFADPVDVDDPEKTSARYLAVITQFWRRVGLNRSIEERNRLLLLAVASALASGPLEVAAAKALAREARAIEASKGKLGASWSGSGGGWQGLAGLREDFVTAVLGDATKVAAFDTLARSTSILSEVVKKFQSWAEDRGWYTGRVDGIWGSRSEGAFLQVVPQAGGRLSSLYDAQMLMTATGMLDAEVLGILISRDKWLRSTGVVRESGPYRIAQPKASEPTAADLPPDDPIEESVDVSQVVVTSPKPLPGAPTGDASRVVVTSPKPPVTTVTTGSARPLRAAGWRPTTSQIVAGALVVTGCTIAALAWRSYRRRPA